MRPSPPTTTVESTIAGWRAITLASGQLEVVVLPERGAELHALRHVPSEIDVLFHAPWGLAPPSAPPREGSGGHGFLERYAGGWQELFPSVNDPTTHAGTEIPFHGEVALREWDVRPEGEELVCRVACATAPFDLERRMRIEDDALVLDETVTNRGDRTAHFVWGHHCVLGPPFLEAGCRLDVAAGTIVTIPELWEDTARLEPGQRSPWPHGALRRGGTVDLRAVPGPEADSHDDVYLTDLTAGRAAVTNPRLGLTFALDFDPAVFRWVITWQPYGGAQAMPLAGAYALGVEPWVARAPLGEAAAAGDAIALAGGHTFSTRLRARVQEGDAWPE